MTAKTPTRRRFLQAALAASSAWLSAPYIPTLRAAEPAVPRSKNDRIRFGAIGLRYQGSVIARQAAAYGDLVALCDVDADILAKARQEFGDAATPYADYRALLDRPDLDAVLIGTPDHWHTRMLIDACRAGKDVYCEKPLTLTIQEGQQIVEVVRDTKQIVQVGTWQRSDSRFRQAVEIARAGRLGKIRKITIVLGKNVQGGPFATAAVPAQLNWNQWQGQTADVAYVPERCHYTFRWWYEYSGGQMTDWGAHHVDIAQWALGQENSGPITIESRATFPTVPGGYNVAKDFQALLTYRDGAQIEILDEGRNGLLIEGDEDRLFVNRGSLTGGAVERLADAPLARNQFSLYPHDNLERPERAGKLDAIINHMGNFVDCLRSRQMPIADVASQHRSVSACHLANISMRLGRTLHWNPETEQCVADDEANRWLSRPQRAGFETKP